MKAFISSITCLLMICTSFTGCGEMNIIDIETRETAEGITFSDAEGVVDHGLTVIEVTDENLYYYSEYGITTTGLVIIESKNSDELMLGDMLLTVNGQRIDAAAGIALVLKECKVGDVVAVTVMRDGREVSVALKLTEKMPDEVSFD